MAIITLPRSSVKEINDKYVKIEIPEKIPQSYADLKTIKKTRGILKSKKQSLLKYVEKTRAEWK